MSWNPPIMLWSIVTFQRVTTRYLLGHFPAAISNRKLVTLRSATDRVYGPASRAHVNEGVRGSRRNCAYNCVTKGAGTVTVTARPVMSADYEPSERALAGAVTITSARWFLHSASPKKGPQSSGDPGNSLTFSKFPSLAVTIHKPRA